MKRVAIALLLLLFLPLTARAADQIEFTPATKKFLTQCSGMTSPPSPEMEPVAFVSCMMWMRGVVDVHNMTVNAYDASVAHYLRTNPQSVMPDIGFKRMWCGPSALTNGQLIATVVSWIAAHEAQVLETNVFFPTNDINTATVVLFSALIETFPCERK